MDRRRYLKQVAVVATIGLAGCSESGTPTSEPESSPTPSPTPTPEMETPTPTDEPMETEAPTDTPTPTSTATPRPDVAAEVTVGPGGSLRFDPDSVTVGTGETVRWVWESSNHNVKPETVPDGSDWTGSGGDRGTTYDTGHVYTHTFEVAGQYDYVCVPHQSAGMTGTVVVE